MKTLPYRHIITDSQRPPFEAFGTHAGEDSNLDSERHPARAQYENGSTQVARHPKFLEGKLEHKSARDPRQFVQSVHRGLLTMFS